MDKLSISKLDNIVDKLGEFNCIKWHLEEYDTTIGNPIYKLLGKLPPSFESFKDNIFLCIPFPSYEEIVGILHDKCISRKSSKKQDSTFVGKAKGKPNQQNKGTPKKGMLRQRTHPRREKNHLQMTTNKWSARFVVGLTTPKIDALLRSGHPKPPKRRPHQNPVLLQTPTKTRRMNPKQR